MKKNILLTIEYDGTNFCGWQRQPLQRTAQGELEAALSLVLRSDICVNGTSRTDSGVHALGQRASFCAEFGIPVDKIKFAVNNILAGRNVSEGRVSDMRILSAYEVDYDFHARFDSTGKKYRYIIENKEEMSVFERNYCYHVRKPLNIFDMKKAAEHIVGRHDFACFQAAGGTPRETTVRTVNSLAINEENRQIKVEIKGDGFLYNMVRIIVGTLVDVGLGKIRPDDVKNIIDSKDRQKAGHTAPPQGLYLVEIYYDDLKERQLNGEGE